MGVGGIVAVNGNVGTFESSGRNDLDIRNLVETSHADGDIAAGGDRVNRNIDHTRFVDKSHTVQHAILADGNV